MNKEEKSIITNTDNKNNSPNFEVNTKILEIIKFYKTHKNKLPKSLIEKCEKYVTLQIRDLISLECIKELSVACRYLVKEGIIAEGPYYVHEILSGTIYVAPVLKPKVLTAEYLKFKEQLTARAEHIRYEKMVKNVKLNKEEERIKELQDMKTVKSSLSVMGNIFAAAATLFVVFYFIGYNMSKQSAWALSLGVFGAIIGFLVEAILFIIRATEIDTVQEKEKKRKKSTNGENLQCYKVLVTKKTS